MYCENNVQHTNARCGQNVEFLTVRLYRMQHFVSYGSMTPQLNVLSGLYVLVLWTNICISLAAAHGARDGV